MAKKDIHTPENEKSWGIMLKILDLCGYNRPSSIPHTPLDRLTDKAVKWYNIALMLGILAGTVWNAQMPPNHMRNFGQVIYERMISEQEKRKKNQKDAVRRNIWNKKPKFCDDENINEIYLSLLEIYEVHIWVKTTTELIQEIKQKMFSIWNAGEEHFYLFEILADLWEERFNIIFLKNFLKIDMSNQDEVEKFKNLLDYIQRIRKFRDIIQKYWEILDNIDIPEEEWLSFERLIFLLGRDTSVSVDEKDIEFLTDPKNGKIFSYFYDSTIHLRLQDADALSELETLITWVNEEILKSTWKVREKIFDLLK